MTRAIDDPRPRRVHVPLTTRIVTERLLLRPFRPADVRTLRTFQIDNEEHLREWNPRPLPGEAPKTMTWAARHVSVARRSWSSDRGYTFAVFARDATRRTPTELVARVALNAVVRGNFQNAYMGYMIAATHEGKGLAREAVAAACDFAFGAARLHRVQAAVMPHNVRSLRLIRSLGFRQEGAAEKYLMIAGDWRDHLIFATTAEEWRERRRTPAE